MPSTVVTGDNLYIAHGSLDYDQNGRLWAAVADTTGEEVRFYYSSDSGVNWNLSTGSTVTGSQQAAGFFIDKDNGAHLVTTEFTTSYRYGTLDPGGTSWTWSSPITLTPSGYSGNSYAPKVVAHREGSGWVAHAIHAEADGSSNAELFYSIIDITSGPSLRSTTQIYDHATNGNLAFDVDFRHEQSDPKAVQSSTPSVYVAYHWTNGPGTTGLLYRKIAYSAGSWTPGTQRTLDANTAADSGFARVTLFYDGTRVVIAHARQATNTVVRVDERDEADTTTTNRDPTALADGLIDDLTCGYGPNQDIYLLAKGDTSDDLKKIRYNRGGASWGSWSVVEADTLIDNQREAALTRGICAHPNIPIIGALYLILGTSPDQVRFETLAAAWEGGATLQGVGTMSPSASLGIAAQASLQGVATVNPQANMGFGPTATLQGVASMDAKGLLDPFKDYTVYDAYIDGLGQFGPSGLIFYEDESAKKTTVSEQLQPARTDVGNQPTEVRPERGETFSQQDFSHGAGQLYFHHEGRDIKRYLWSEGFDVDIDTVGQPATLEHLNAVGQALASANTGKIVVFNGQPFVIDGTSLKRNITGSLPGSWNDDPPHAGETATTPQDLASSGEYLYAALGANGIHRRDTSGAWTHWSDVQATRVAWLKNRIIASDGPSLYEVISAGAAPTPIETLPTGWAFESIFEVSGFVYATAVSTTSELSRIHAYKLNTAGTALEKRSETPFPRDQLIFSGSGYLDNVLLGGGIKNSDGGFDPVVYQAGVADQDTGALSYSKIAEGEGAGAANLSVKAFEARGEDVAFGYSLGSGFAFGSRDGLALLKLKVGGFFPYLKTPTAGESRQVLSVTLWNGVLLFTVQGKGVYYEDTAKVVAEAVLYSSVADYNTTANKVWDLAQVSHAPLPADTSVRLETTSRLPGDQQFDLAVFSDTDDAEIKEARFDDLTSRLLAVRLTSKSNAGQTLAPRGIGFLVRSNLRPDTPEWNLTRYIRLMQRDRKDGGGEDVFITDVQETLRQIQGLAYRIVSFYEPGVKWTARIDRIADMTPFLPRYWEREGEPRREVYILQLSMSGTRD